MMTPLRKLQMTDSALEYNLEMLEETADEIEAINSTWPQNVYSPKNIGQIRQAIKYISVARAYLARIPEVKK